MTKYENYRRIFMPLAWQDINERLKKGEFLSPSPNYWAKIAAGFYAAEAILSPHKAAAKAVGFFARGLNN